MTSPTGVGPVALGGSFDSASLSDADRAAIAGGQFKVVLSGTAVTAFTGGNATADLRATFTFVAYE